MKKKGIAIDGPAGVGKSTIVKLIAKKLNICYVDSGAFYRTIAFCIISNDMNIQDVLEMPEDEIEDLLGLIDIGYDYNYDDHYQIVHLNGKLVKENEIRNEVISNATSLLSTNIHVRNKVTNLCKSIAEDREVIMEGRDIGTSIMVNAKLKIYLDADPLERAKRRSKQLSKAGIATNSLEQILQDIIERDRLDFTRELSPLKKAEDAVVVDTTNLTIDGVVEKIIGIYDNL